MIFGILNVYILVLYVNRAFARVFQVISRSATKFRARRPDCSMDQFGAIPIDVRALLESVLKNYSISEEDLYFKCKTFFVNKDTIFLNEVQGESWVFKMGNNPPLDIEHATLFKQDIQNQLETSNQHSSKSKSVTKTPASSKKVSANVVGSGYEDL